MLSLCDRCEYKRESRRAKARCLYSAISHDLTLGIGSIPISRFSLVQPSAKVFQYQAVRRKCRQGWNEVQASRAGSLGSRQEIIYRHQATHQLKFFRPNGA